MTETVITAEEFASRFEAFRESCLTGHDAGCTYGGMSPSGGYWLAVEGCPLSHGESCAICGQDTEAGFGDWAYEAGEPLMIWGVPLCAPHAELELIRNPGKWGSVGGAA